jgi:hypothetical protein
MLVISHQTQTIDNHRIAFAFPGPFDYEPGICLIQNQDKYDALYGLDISANSREMLGMPALEIRYRNDAEAAILREALPLAPRLFISSCSTALLFGLFGQVSRTN